MYYAENEAQPEAFSSIPAAMWRGVATFTTVGYGDVYPITPPKRIPAGQEDRFARLPYLSQAKPREKWRQRAGQTVPPLAQLSGRIRTRDVRSSTVINAPTSNCLANCSSAASAIPPRCLGSTSWART